MTDEELDDQWLYPSGQLVSRRQVLKASVAALGATAAGPLLYTSVDAFEPLRGANLPYHANRSVKGHITFWHFWASPLRHNAVRTIIKEFNRFYPHVTVHDIPFNFGDIWTKNVAAVAAGKGMPDVLVSNRPTLWYDAGKHHLYENIAHLVKKDHINHKVFWPFTWYESVYKGGVYGLPYETDCRVLFWNRAAFIDAGLNSNKGPTTWGDAEGMAGKLDNKGAQFITFNPLWGNSMDISGWVWTDNGDAQTKKGYPTVASPKMVAAGDWIKFWYDRYGTGLLNAISAQQTPGKDQFGSGHAAMEVQIPGQQAVMNYYGVEFKTKSGKLPFPYWGVGLVPHAPGGKSRSFSGGFALSMPTSHHRSGATTAATWEFMKFMTLVGQRTWAQLTNGIPTVESIAKHDNILSAQPHWHTFMQAMALGHPADRNYYDVNFPGDVVGHAQDQITSGQDVRASLKAAQAQALVNLKRGGGP